MSELDIGILALQGDVAENLMSTMEAMNELGIDGSVSQVKTPDQISALDGLIIPGGESTMMGQLSITNGAMNSLKEKIESGIPVLGICAGMILLSKNSKDRVLGATKQPLLDVLDVEIERNSFGRQKDSFEAEVSMEPIGIPSFHGVFIRAPAVVKTGSGVETLGKFNEKIIAVKQGNILATSFHPELTRDVSVHKQFVQMVKDSKS
ncbi:pyridoxal 5'-phosphate synthase glutaminase subunit PdxT [Marine Group I thaumarchaeote]|uniref:Pyridoxal 5'-phosphate synthase subunit PdxT n=1 Tax=Marine Group I thaumarchaeote TaxID=2511932 RepID=A0A7K4N5A3_9ARCH|nr:pyridoxal 5'-phosphate synthase glutaminase subunit PdxT [Marine Group I thaumarchaeote]